ncbi:MAG TPA: TolC family protein [Gemmatimonadales bacterium]|nr:TolC family protein [Gemmatimonadales bacterium]
MKPSLEYRTASGAALLALAAACAPYVPAPIDPAARAEAFAARSLDAPGLAEYLAAHGSRAPAGGWGSADLALAALYWQPGLDRARADWRAARAGEITAGARPQPEIQSEIGRATSGAVFESRWLASLFGLFTLETGGKRGARIAAARARTALAEVDLDETAWRAARQVRSAFVDAAAAAERLADARAELARIAGFAERLRARYEEGAVGRGELAAIEAEETAARVAAANEARTLASARSALARAVAVPAAALESLALAAEDPPACAGTTDSVQALALRRRYEIGRGLAEYAIAEADLRGAVAGARPDVQLGPGFTWDQGIARWSLLLNLPRLVLNRNRGPIAEATERRSAAAARFSEMQQGVIADVAAAVAACRVSQTELAGADSVAAAVARRAAVARGAYERGEIGAADLEPLELEETRALRARHAARHHLAAAGVALEAATGAWPPGDITWPDPREPRELAEGPR